MPNMKILYQPKHSQSLSFTARSSFFIAFIHFVHDVATASTVFDDVTYHVVRRICNTDLRYSFVLKFVVGRI